MHKLLVILAGITGAAMLSAQKLPQAVQQLNFDGARELIAQHQYTEKERVEANQAIITLLQEKSKPVALYKNFGAWAQLALSATAGWYMGTKAAESVKAIIPMIDHDERFVPLTFFYHYCRSVAGFIGLTVCSIYAFRALQKFNLVSNPDYLNALAISAVLKVAKPGVA